MAEQLNGSEAFNPAMSTVGAIGELTLGPDGPFLETGSDSKFHGGQTRGNGETGAITFDAPAEPNVKR